MKKVILALSIALVAFSSCKKDDEPSGPSIGETKTNVVDQTAAPAKDQWAYISLDENKIVGMAADDTDVEWAKRSDWDIAIKRTYIRTNSGTSSSNDAKGGVYTFAEGTSFASVNAVPTGATFVADKLVGGMGGVKTNRSTAVSVGMKQELKPDGSMGAIMPPQYIKAPLYILRTSNGQKMFKVEFISYKNAADKTGYVEFQFAEIK